MSAYSTLEVTREYAISQIIAKIYQADDEKLADLLLEAIGYETLNNFRIVNKENDNDK